MKVGRWSTNAGSNNATPPDGCPEGQAPSTLNDCMRENMAAIRTVFADPQFFDQDWTPTCLTISTFSVPGNQTSAIHAGRRLKLYDASTYYATVTTASFTTVTTIQVETDNGQTLTSSLSSFGISVLSNTNNGLPRNVTQSMSSLDVDTLSVSSTATIAVLNVGSIACSATAVALNLPKAICMTAPFAGSTTSNISLRHSFNVSSLSRVGTGSYRLTFTNAMPDSSYTYLCNIIAPDDTSGTNQFFVADTTAGPAASTLVIGIRSNVTLFPADFPAGGSAYKLSFVIYR